MIDAPALDALFREARTHSRWDGRPVTDDDLRAVFETMKLGPTSANCSPARFVFVRTPEEKDRLKPTLSPGNVDKTMAAPVTAIVAYDPHFYHYLPRLYPDPEAREWFMANPDLAAETAFRNGSLQGGYFILAARAHGIDCGPMSGFDNSRVDSLFLSDRGWKSNFLVNLGHGVAEALAPRAPRLNFDETCRLI